MQPEVSTVIGKKTSTSPSKVDDYVVGHFFAQAQANGDDLKIVETLSVDRSGLRVNDWTAFEAVMRYVFHSGLSLPRPPLAHPCLVSIPPHLEPTFVDKLHAFFFERMFVPQLLIGTRPFFAAGAVGVTSCVVLDIGARGEGTEISVVHDNQIVQGATMRTMAVDEGVLDDWCALKLLEADPALPTKLADGTDKPAATLSWALRTIVNQLKTSNSIGFASPFLGSAVRPAKDAVVTEDGELDVAKVLVEGKLDKIVNKKKGRDKDGSGLPDEDADTVEVAHPSQPDAEPLRIGPARHRYLEPLFNPEVIAELAPSASPTAQMLGLTAYEGQERLYSGVQEMIGSVVDRIDKLDKRSAVLESLVVVSTGSVANNRALGNTLVTLLGPYTMDNESGSDAQPKIMRYARTPDYFSEFKERPGELACFLGGSIFAKILISDLQSRLFMSKVDYTSRGPAFYRMIDGT